MEPLRGGPDEAGSLELVARIQAGDDAAWDELYRRYHDPLLLAARLRLGRELRLVLESGDIFQAVALQALQALRRFEYRGPGSLERFLKTLVANEIRDRARYHGAARRAGAQPLDDFDEPADGAEPYAGYHEAETYERLERAVRSLPDDMREVLVLRKVDGLSSREVAERTGRSDEAVRQITSRAMARVAKAMRER